MNSKDTAKANLRLAVEARHNRTASIMGCFHKRVGCSSAVLILHRKARREADCVCLNALKGMEGVNLRSLTGASPFLKTSTAVRAIQNILYGVSVLMVLADIRSNTLF